MRGHDAETLNMQKQDDTRNAKMEGSTTTKPEETFQWMLNAVGYRLSELAKFDPGVDGEDKEDD